jgi:hypothetical protein
MGETGVVPLQTTTEMTNEDEELSKAIEMSMQEGIGGKFEPLNWAKECWKHLLLQQPYVDLLHDPEACVGD